MYCELNKKTKKWILKGKEIGFIVRKYKYGLSELMNEMPFGI